MAKVDVVSKGDFGYHPASGQHLHEGARYTIDEEAFSEELFELAGPDDEPEAAEGQTPRLHTETEGGGN